MPNARKQPLTVDQIEWTDEIPDAPQGRRAKSMYEPIAEAIRANPDKVAKFPLRNSGSLYDVRRKYPDIQFATRLVGDRCFVFARVRPIEAGEHAAVQP